MWGHMDGFGWGGMGFGMILFWGLIVVVIAVLLRVLWGGGAPAERGQGRSALDVLKERYARGEIEREEFEQKKRDLST
ncbi:MAG: SHOCT domain-containing protein [Rhodocyclaceae bacterium]|nr:SHOCT domain-containing protein [Rhodocyclaceae bacterium]MBZ0133091.1 SHOCT domain-containing protein [Rhodocyclaceae bacterium]MCP5297303.1 SHOCT domain-containing protein [Zoogloeaceae bacterium]MCZ7653064.1 SHOCT domain-containing protein [Rhodocyclaceae bacterium]